MKTAEDCIRDNCNVEYSKFTGEEIVVSSLSDVCIAIEEYARQSSSLSDEEIEKWAVMRINQIDPDEYGYGDLLIEGAKWARDRQKGGKG